jgi:hypothetical protein
MIHNPALIKEVFESCMVELHALTERKDLSSYLDFNRLLAKSFLLSCASFYEDEITRIARAVLDSGRHSAGVRSWLHSVAVEGQFYKWFDFRSAKNTNPFLGRFGNDFKEGVRNLLQEKDSRRKAESDFLELCQKRNECVHRNYAAYSLELTLGELYDKHRSAMSYIRVIDYGARRWLILGP